MRVGVTKQVNPPGTDGVDIALTFHVFEPDSLTTFDRQQLQPLVIFHLRRGMPEHIEITLTDFFVLTQICIPFQYGAMS
jgi:hypothetical protein